MQAWEAVGEERGQNGQECGFGSIGSAIVVNDDFIARRVFWRIVVDMGSAVVDVVTPVRVGMGLAGLLGGLRRRRTMPVLKAADEEFTGESDIYIETSLCMVCLDNMSMPNSLPVSVKRKRPSRVITYVNIRPPLS